MYQQLITKALGLMVQKSRILSDEARKATTLKEFVREYKNGNKK